MSILDYPSVRHSALPISVDQYHQLGQTAIIPENTELIRGVIIGKMNKSPLHSWTVQFLVDTFRSALKGNYHLRQEQPLTFADSEPEPDIAIVHGQTGDYRTSHPMTARLVIEVAIATSALDRAKAELYAAAEIPEYWLVLPHEGKVEIYSDPQDDQYREHRILTPPDELSLNDPLLKVRLDELLAG